MIEFVTLLLGLVVGPHQVEVAVGPQVQAVHWVLDGQSVAARREPPWRATIQFGAELKPHRLVAVGIDRTGRPVARAEQLINYIRSSHEVVVVLESDPEEPRAAGDHPAPRRGRVVAQGVLGHRPTRISVRFDDIPLEVVDHRFTLPDYDSERPHAVQAEVQFSDGAVAKTETTFGGGMGEEVTSALSAVAVTSRKGRPWSAEDVRGWLQRDGRPLPVFQTRAEGGQVVIVRDEGLSPSVLRNLPIPAMGDRSDQGRRAYQLSAVSPVPLRRPNITFRESILGTVLSKDGLLLSLVSPLESYGFSQVKDPEPDIWGALAIAGRSAASSNMPRVVVLLLGAETPRGELEPLQVLRYLESIHVPVLIWALNRRPLKELGLHKLDGAYFGPGGLGSVVQRASSWIDSQTMIWVEGEVLPTEVELVSSRKRVSFVGR